MKKRLGIIAGILGIVLAVIGIGTEAERKHSRFCYWWCGWPDFYFHSREVKW